MPLLLTSQDISPLLDDPSSVDGLLSAVASAYRDPHPFEMGGRNLLDVPLIQGEPLRVFPSVAAHHGTALRIDPAFQQQQRQLDPSRLVVLFDARGRLRSIVSGDLVYALRIAAPVALAARLLAPAETRTLAVLGTGAEARAHLPVLLRVLRSLQEVRVFSATAQHRAAFVAAASASTHIPVRASIDAASAVDRADVVAALTSASRPIFEADALRPGALVLAIGRGQIPPALVATARLFVATRAAFQHGGGRTVADPNRQLADVWASAEPIGELADLIEGRVVGRERPDQTVLYQLIGLPGTDAAIAGFVTDWAEAQARGTQLVLS